MSYWDRKELEARLSGAPLEEPLEAQQVRQWGPLLDLDCRPALLVVEGAKKRWQLQRLPKVLDLQQKQVFLEQQ